MQFGPFLDLCSSVFVDDCSLVLVGYALCPCRSCSLAFVEHLVLQGLAVWSLWYCRSCTLVLMGHVVLVGHVL